MSRVVKTCSNCRRMYTREQFDRLPLVGLLDEDGSPVNVPYQPRSAIKTVARNCMCGSTIAIPHVDCVAGRVLDTTATPWTWIHCGTCAEA